MDSTKCLNVDENWTFDVYNIILIIISHFYDKSYWRVSENGERGSPKNLPHQNNIKLSTSGLKSGMDQK